MTPQEAIETMKIAIAEAEWNYPMDYAVAFENAISALEKQTPKKPRVNDDSWFCCRNCGETFSLANTVHRKNKYCGNCGQALDWSDTNDR